MRPATRILLLAGAGAGAALVWWTTRPAPPRPTPPPGTPDPFPFRAIPRPAAPWVAPAADGSCPAGHPVKANASSGIFHVPGGSSYERTRADRCYATAEAAAADGFRPAKR